MMFKKKPFGMIVSLVLVVSMLFAILSFTSCKKDDVNIDTDNDGKPDVNVDTNGDGDPDINIDTDDDGKADTNIDTDGDKKPDENIDFDFGDGIELPVIPLD